MIEFVYYLLSVGAVGGALEDSSGTCCLTEGTSSVVFGTCTLLKLALCLLSGHHVRPADGLQHSLVRKQFVHQDLNIRGLGSHLRVL